MDNLKWAKFLAKHDKALDKALDSDVTDVRHAQWLVQQFEGRPAQLHYAGNQDSARSLLWVLEAELVRVRMPDDYIDEVVDMVAEAFNLEREIQIKPEPDEVPFVAPDEEDEGGA